MEPQQPILVYRSLMELAKTRIACIRRIASGSLSLGDDRLNWELAALQLRMVLELVAFASLSAHKGAYAAAHANFARHWKAALLLKELAAIHPDFYPQPRRLDRLKDGGVAHFDQVDDFLTQEQFVTLYDLCSQVVHTANPFGDLKPIDFGVSVATWVDRIQALLDCHFIRMYESPQLWVVQMKAGPTGSVQIAVAEPRTV